MLLLLQIILCCLLYLALVKCAVRDSGRNCLYFYPDAYLDEAQKRGIADKTEELRKGKRFMTFFCLVIFVVLIAVIAGWNGVKDFHTACFEAYLFLVVMNWFDGICMDLVWVAHGKEWAIPGMEGIPYIKPLKSVFIKRTAGTVLYFIIAYIVLARMFPADVTKIEGAEQFIQEKIRELGHWTRAQKNTVFCFGVAVVLWVLPGFLSIALDSTSPVLKMYNRLFPEAVAAMLGALLLFLLPVNFKKREFTLSWKDAKDGIEWATLILFGGGLAMGGMMYKTGLSKWVGDGIIAMMGGEPSAIAMVAVFSVMALLLSELTSHTAATNMIGPLAITAAISAGMNPVPVSVAIALSASLGFMLPVSTPPNAIVYASGYIPITKMIRTGVYIDVIGIACVTIPLCIYFVSWIIG